jgi:hypothetical protein
VLLGVVRPSERSELPEQGRQVAVYVGERDVGLFAPLPPAEGVQDQKRFVRRSPLATALDVELVELAEDQFTAHASLTGLVASPDAVPSFILACPAVCGTGTSENRRASAQ